MYSIAYIIPYFGKLRTDFPLWLESCRHNPTVDFHVITDDHSYENHTEKNVFFHYMQFSEMQERTQKIFDFKIYMDRPYKLCDFKPAYGEIFPEIIEGYDFWGHCDMDLIFGDIRKFVTEEVLERYDRVGEWGHSILYRNNPESNARYRTCINGVINYKEAFSSEKSCFFDEIAVLKIYDAIGVETYKGLKIADIYPSYWQLQVFSKDPVEREKNKHRIFQWKEGKLVSYSLYQETIATDEYMYIHFLRRPMKQDDYSKIINTLVIIPNEIHNVKDFVPTQEYIKKVSANRMDKYWISMVKRKWRQATPEKVFVYFRGRLKGAFRKLFKGGQ